MTNDDKKYFKSLIKQGKILHSSLNMRDYFIKNNLYYITNPKYTSFGLSCMAGNIIADNPHNEYKTLSETEFYSKFYSEQADNITIKPKL